MSRVYDVFLTVRAWLHDEGESPMTPDYINDILARTAVSKQRPAWQSPWRWLLMRTTDTIRTVPRIAWPVLIAVRTVRRRRLCTWPGAKAGCLVVVEDVVPFAVLVGVVCGVLVLGILSSGPSSS